MSINTTVTHFNLSTNNDLYYFIHFYTYNFDEYVRSKLLNKELEETKRLLEASNQEKR
jgi:hypothetical protein